MENLTREEQFLSIWRGREIKTNLKFEKSNLKK